MWSPGRGEWDGWGHSIVNQLYLNNKKKREMDESPVAKDEGGQSKEVGRWVRKLQVRTKPTRTKQRYL